MPLQDLAPFLVAALAGAALAFFELLKTFQRIVGSALRSKWGMVPRAPTTRCGFPLKATWPICRGN